MSSSVGRNSLIMATGTAASRVTGQLRTILLAAAIGTTGLAANAYQAGSMIPQSVFTLVSGGIFNAVLVPQIVRTLKEKDAQERLNRLITLAIGILLAMTVVMAAASPLLARLYVGSDDHQMIALTTSFTLWCMPQVFFYHTFHYSQSNSGSFPIFFRCKKRFKHMLSKVFWNTTAIIFYHKPYHLAIIYT